MLVPATSTYWPGDEMRRGDLGADRDSASSETRNSASFALRLDLGLGEMAALRLRHVLDLGGADAELQRGVAVLLEGPLATTWQLSICSTVTGTWLPSSVNTRVMPSFCAISPVPHALCIP